MGSQPGDRLGVAGVLTALVGWLAGGAAFPGGLAVATVALALASAAMSGSTDVPPSTPARGDSLLRMAATAALVAVLATMAELLGPLLGGMLAGLPVLASVLAVFTHRRDGSAAVVALLNGMLSGMAGFVGFCAVVALLIVPLGTAPAFATATAAAVGLQVLPLARRGSSFKSYDATRA